MDSQVKKLDQLIKDSSRITISSHLAPDADAVCSALLLANTLKENFPKKQVLVGLDEKPQDLEFLSGYEQIKFGSLFTNIKLFKPELLIITDANNYDRCSRFDGPDIRHLIQKTSTKTITIDHHEPGDSDKVDLYIHQHSPATTQTIYHLLFEKLKFKKPAGYAETTLLGIISDTSRFLYENPDHRQTFAIVSDLLDAGASIESLANRQSHYSKKDMKILGELSNNVAVEGDYTYSFLSDSFKSAWVDRGHTAQELKEGVEIFVNGFLRNIDGRSWGFIIYPDLIGPNDVYGVSFRSVTGTKDVSKIAGALGGGGHKPAAGAKITAHSVEKALEEVKLAISELKPSS